MAFVICDERMPGVSNSLLFRICERRYLMKLTIGKRAMALLLCVCTVFAAFSGGIIPVMAADDSWMTGGTDGHVADISTMNTFVTALDLYSSSRYAGRVWSDKSVFKGDAVVDGVSGGSDFLHVFSALGSSLKTSIATRMPLDVVFILDTSYSMVSNSGIYGGTSNNSPNKNRLSMAAVALDEAMKLVMDANDKNRVGLVEFSSDSYEVMSLGRYTPNGDHYFTYTPYNSSATIGRIEIKASAEAGSGGAIEGKRGADVSYDVPFIGGTGTVDDARLTPLRPDTLLGYGTGYKYGMTNTQAGLYRGMNMLATASLGTDEEQRVPIVVLITDGQPTRSMTKGGGNTTSIWWDPAGEVPHGEEGTTSSRSYAGHGLQALATASYMKSKISEHYFGTDKFDGNTDVNPFYKTHVFTFGLETGVLEDDDKDLAASVMEPLEGLKENNNMANGIKTGWSTLCGGETFGFYDGGGTITMQPWTDSPDKAYERLTSDPNAVTALNYVDEFVPVDNADDLPGELSRVLTFSVNSAPWVPVAGKNDVQATGENMLTYIDPIGKYMEIKDVKKLRLFGQMYTLRGGSEITDPATGITTQYYTVTGANVNELRWNPAYGARPDNLVENTPGVYKLSDIKIYVQTTGDNDDPNLGGGSIESDLGYDQALYVDIPANALPIWLVSVTLKGDQVIYTTNRGKYEGDTDGVNPDDASPLRVYYTVGMADDVLDGDGEVDLSLVDDDYIAENKADDNATVYFYSNWYKEKKYNYILTQDYTYGDPVMSFSPAEDNRYYICQKNLTVYECDWDNNDALPPEITDAGTISGLTPATSVESDGWYYIVIDYYTPSGYKQIAVPRVGSMFGSGIGSDEVGFGAYLNWVDTTGTSEPKNYTEGGSAPDDSGNWVIATKIGGLRTGNMSQNVASKKTNPTDPANGKKTSGTYYLPTISRGSGIGADGTVINNYMGNNGRLSVTATNEGTGSGELKIEKTVDNVSESTLSDKFSFTVTLTLPDEYNGETDAAKLPNTFSYTGYTIEGAAFAGSVTAPAGGNLVITGWKKNTDGRWYASGVVKLSHGQGILITDLPDGTDYEVTETVPDGYRLKDSEGTEGTIISGGDVPVARFINEKLVVLPVTGGTGTTRYKLTGCMLLLGAAVYLLSERMKRTGNV